MGEIKIIEPREPMTKDGDGGGSGSPISHTVIEKVDNGYIVVWINDEQDEVKEVYNSRDELLTQLKIYL